MPGVYRLAPSAAIVLLLLLGASIAGAEPPAIPQEVAPDSVTATVRYVHPEQRGFEVIIGVQYALRLEYFRVAEDTRIQREGEPIALADLEPGDLIWVDYSQTDEGKVARAIRVLARQEEGGAG